MPVSPPTPLRLLPLALALILVTTAMPVDLRAPTGWDGAIEPLDLLLNLLLYLPLGLALWRWPRARLLLAAAALSTAIEISQGWNSDRHPSPGDVAANAAGALLAAAWVRRRRRAARPVDPERFAVGRRGLIATGALLAGLVALGQAPAKSVTLADWDPQYALLLGNETTGDRPWRGTLESLAVLPARLSAGQLRAASRHPARVAGLACVTHTSTALAGGPPVALEPDLARDLALAAQDAGGVAVVARIVPTDIEQKGPARILSFSAGARLRNLDLGQEERALVFRFRTPLTGSNGTRRPVETGDVLAAGRAVTVAAGYDGRVARVYVDGRLHGRENLAAEACLAPVLADEELPALCAVLGGAATLMALGLLRGRRRAVAMAAAAGLAFTAALPWLLPGLALALAAMPWWMAGGGAGVAAVAIAAAGRPAAPESAR
ncbi:hypothetical protein FJ250_11025 [bacterium]|nr:hypothetical protein [bacterium]